MERFVFVGNGSAELEYAAALSIQSMSTSVFVMAINRALQSVIGCWIRAMYKSDKRKKEKNETETEKTGQIKN